MSSADKAGNELDEGYCDLREVLTEDDIRAIFSHIYSSRSKKTTSYKFALINAILCNLANVDKTLSLSFDTVFYYFAQSYWNIIVHSGIRPARKDHIASIYRIIDELSHKLDINEPLPFESLSENNCRTVVKKVMSDAKKYVIGALFGDSMHTFYSFSKKDEVITLNPVVYQYLLKNKTLIEKVNFLEWTKYLLDNELDEENPKNVIDTLTLSTKRYNLSSFQKILYDELNEHCCFYCKKILKDSEIHVDHFIPWSFIKDDQLWNFVISCSHCNESKNDRLASEKELQDLIDRNKYIIEMQQKNMLSHKDVSLINTDEYDSSTLKRFYHIARMNGFELWHKKN